MKNIAVIYKSKYGSAKQYAEWIAEALNAQAFDSSSINLSKLSDYDIVIYGGGLYAGRINGVKPITKANCKQLVLFTVGLEHTTAEDCSEILAKSFTAEQLSVIKAFHFPGSLDYEKMGLIHKGMMAIVKKEADKKPIAERNKFDNFVIETYGKSVNYVDRSEITTLVEYVRGL